MDDLVQLAAGGVEQLVEAGLVLAHRLEIVHRGKDAVLPEQASEDLRVALRQ